MRVATFAPMTRGSPARPMDAQGHLGLGGTVVLPHGGQPGQLSMPERGGTGPVAALGQGNGAQGQSFGFGHLAFMVGLEHLG